MFTQDGYHFTIFTSEHSKIAVSSCNLGLAVKVALVRAECAPLRLQGPSINTLLDHAVPDVVHGVDIVGGELAAAVPQLRVDVGLVRLLAPQARLPAHDLGVLLGRRAVERVEGEDLHPRLERVTPAVADAGGAGRLGRGGDPAALSACTLA